MTSRFAVGPAVGVAGAVFLCVASVITALVYRGVAGEGYSPLNHWVSELGEVGVSNLAILFNIGLVIGGLGLAVFMASLGTMRRSRLAWFYVPVGILAGIAGALVGIFPMNNAEPHRLAALTFFNLGWICVALASIDLYRRPDPRFPRWLPWLGAATVIAFVAFLSLYVPWLASTDSATAARPAFSLMITLEWLVLAGIIIWILIASLTWWRARGSTD